MQKLIIMHYCVRKDKSKQIIAQFFKGKVVTCIQPCFILHDVRMYHAPQAALLFNSEVSVSSMGSLDFLLYVNIECEVRPPFSEKRAYGYFLQVLSLKI
jgi:hypothetical protein